jgi:hypothetical protein
MKVQVATWPGAGTAGRVLPLAERLGLVSELTQALDLATRSGQEHLMHKVLAILRGELLEVRAPLGGTDLAYLLDAMSELEHEAGRIAPLPNAFNRQARVVIDALLRTSGTVPHMSAFSTP